MTKLQECPALQTFDFSSPIQSKECIYAPVSEDLTRNVQTLEQSFNKLSFFWVSLFDLFLYRIVI